MRSVTCDAVCRTKWSGNDRQRKTTSREFGGNPTTVARSPPSSTERNHGTSVVTGAFWQGCLPFCFLPAMRHHVAQSLRHKVTYKIMHSSPEADAGSETHGQGEVFCRNVLAEENSFSIMKATTQRPLPSKRKPKEIAGINMP